jgi:streptomycin 6-kinase
LLDSDGGTAVLKLTPELAIAATEATALRTWAGCSRVVHLIDTDVDAGAVLLAGVVPGTPLAESPDPAPMDQIAELLGQLRSATPVDGLPTVSERAPRCCWSIVRRRCADRPCAAPVG